MTARGIISVSDLSFRYNGSEQPVLTNVSLDIPAGQVAAILGPNGSGKTTLLRLLLGVLQPKRGTILLAGRPQGSFSRRERSQLVGLMPQEENVAFELSVLEFVLLGRAPYLGPLDLPGEGDRQIALAAIQKVGLSHLHDRPVPTLSGGERQLAILARALAQRPSILLMDEPAAHLDLSNRGLLLDIMRTLVTDGVTVVFTTHDPNLAAAVTTFAVLMHRGQVLAAGPAEAMLTTDRLSATYGVPIQVLEVENRRIIWQL